MSPPQQDQLRTLFARTDEVELAYLFGSHVRDATGPMSDVDLALRVDRERMTDGVALQARLAHEAAGVLGGEDVDLMLLRRAPVEFAYRVIAHGTLLYRRSRVTQVDYEAHVLGRYGDYLPVLRAQRDQLTTETSHDARVQRYRTALGRTERTLSAIGSPSGEGENRV